MLTQHLFTSKLYQNDYFPNRTGLITVGMHGNEEISNLSQVAQDWSHTKMFFLLNF